MIAAATRKKSDLILNVFNQKIVLEDFIRKNQQRLNSFALKDAKLTEIRLRRIDSGGKEDDHQSERKLMKKEQDEDIITSILIV